MANGSGAAIAGVVVGIIIVSQAGGSEGDGEGIADSPTAVEPAEAGPDRDSGDDGEPEVPRAVEGGLATSHTDDLWARIGDGASIPVNPRVVDQVCPSVFDPSWHSLDMSTRRPPSIISWPGTR